MRFFWCFIWLALLCPVISVDWYYGQIDDIILSFNDVADNDSITFNNVKHLVQENRREDNEELCRSQLKSIFQGVEKREKWALKVIDSWGKLPSGFLWGSLTDLGHFDECMNVAHDFGEGNEEVYISQYCLASYPISSIISEKNYRTDYMVMNSSKPSNLAIGTCVPDTCNTTVLNEVFKELIYKYTNDSIEGSIFEEAQCTRHKPVIFKGIDIFAIVLFSSIGILLIVSTVYDIYAEETNKTKNNLFLAFSVISNGKKLFKIDTSKSSERIECLNGMRCLSIFWVIYCHSYLTMLVKPLMNYKILWEWIQDYYSMIVITGTVAVDTFFLISGFLVTLHICKELDRSGKLNILFMYLHRYLRLFPLLGVIILFSVTFHKYIGNGPYWNIATLFVESPCKVFWWSALLHIQTLVNPSIMCLGHTWYLSTDTQMYLLSPLIVIPLWKWGKKFIIVVLLLIIATMSYIFATVMIKEFNLKVLQQGLVGDNEKKLYLYYGLHTRASSWLIGTLLAYFIRQRKGKKLKLPIYVICIGWLISIALIAAVLFVPYRAQQLLDTPILLETAFYESFNRPLWGIALSWIIFACMHGYGSIINSILSLPIWQPISRLTYAMYLSHLLVQVSIFGIMRTNISFTNFVGVTNFWSELGVTLTISVAIVLAFESPFIALEKYLLSRGRTRKATGNLPPVQFKGVETRNENSKS